MKRMIPELIDMRRRAEPDTVLRRLAERCLELCFQEVSANDERFAPLPEAIAEDIARVLGRATC